MKGTLNILWLLIFIHTFPTACPAEIVAKIADITPHKQVDTCPTDAIASNLCWAACIQSLIELDACIESQCCVMVYSNQLEGYVVTVNEGEDDEYQTDYDCCNNNPDNDDHCWQGGPDGDPWCNRTNGLAGDEAL